MNKEMSLQECSRESGVAINTIHLWIKTYNLEKRRKLINGKYHTILSADAVNLIFERKKYTRAKRKFKEKTEIEMNKTVKHFFNDMILCSKNCKEKGINFDIGKYMEYWRK